MLRATVLLATALASTTLWGSQDSQPVRIDRAKLEWFKKLTPEQKKMLREKLEQLKKLPPEERQRLAENWKKWRELPEEARRAIQDRLDQLTPDERKMYAELTHLYFRQFGKEAMRGFPRELFFIWLRREHPTDVERIRYLDKAKRAEFVERFMTEFKELSLTRAEQHLRLHRCLPVERLDGIRNAPAADFWLELSKLMQEARAKHPAPRKPGQDVRDKRPGGPKTK